MVHGWALILALSCALGREEQRVTLCRASTDGVGSQYYQRMLLWLRACREGLVYVNTPMPVVPRHNVSAEMAARVDAHFNLAERACDGGDRAAAACLPCAHAGERVKTFHNARERGNERSADDACYRALLRRFGEGGGGGGGGGGDARPVFANRSRATAVHIRRGDRSAGLGNFTNERYARLLRGLPDVHVYSEGARADFGPLNALRIAWHLNEDPLVSHRAMVESRRFVGNPHSCFSWAVYLLRKHDGLNYDICTCSARDWAALGTRGALRDCVPSSRCVLGDGSR